MDENGHLDRWEERNWQQLVTAVILLWRCGDINLPSWDLLKPLLPALRKESRTTMATLAGKMAQVGFYEGLIELFDEPSQIPQVYVNELAKAFSRMPLNCNPVPRLAFLIFTQNWQEIGRVARHMAGWGCTSVTLSLDDRPEEVAYDGTMQGLYLSTLLEAGQLSVITEHVDTPSNSLEDMQVIKDPFKE